MVSLSDSFVVSVVYTFHIHLPLQIPCKTVIAEEFIMNCALINSLDVNRVKVFAFTCLLHSS